MWKFQWECPSAISWVQNGIEGWDIWPFTIFTRYTLIQWKNVMLSQVKTFDRHYLMDLCLFISLNIILKIVFVLCYLQQNNNSKWMDSQKSLIYREKWEKIRLYHFISKAGTYCMILYDIFSAYRLIHAHCEQNKPLKWSLNYVCVNAFFKYVIDGKIYMKLSKKAREKNYFQAKELWTPFFVFKCVKF